MDVVTVPWPSFERVFVTARSDHGADGRLFDDIALLCRERDLRILGQDVFGSCELHADGVERMGAAFDEISWPFTWIEGNGGAHPCIRGTQAYAVAGANVRPVRLGDRVVGSVFEDEDACYCILGDILPSSRSDSRAVQAREVFEGIEAALGAAEMDLSHLTRTWLYIDDILSWYTDFNDVRTRFFEERGVFDGLVPASTGVGVRNASGTALVADAVAIRPKNDAVRVESVSSPLQCSATDYRSSFSRAVEVASPSGRILYVSGTASIEPAGATAHVGDVRAQIDLTMEVVEAILKSRNMSWEHAARALAYFKDMKDAPLFDAYCAEMGRPRLPVAVAHADICRDDLLFEIEVDAVAVE